MVSQQNRQPYCYLLELKNYFTDLDWSILWDVLLLYIVMSNLPFLRKNEEVQKTKGQRGLRNLGNTCFMNAVIQVLSNCEPFRKSILQVEECIPNERDAPLTKHLSGVIRDLWEGPSNKPSDPRGMFRVITRCFPQFRGYGQQDAHDFSRHLLEGILKELKDCSVGSSMISYLFTGRYLLRIKCARCSEKTCKEESFRELPISMNSGLALAYGCESQIKDRFKSLKEYRKESLNSSLREFTAEKMVEIAQCSCGSKKGKSKITVTDLPEILVITLKWVNGSNHKKFEFPDLLDMSICVDKDQAEANTCKYHLFASVKHSGSEFGGHYKAFCKNNDKWFLYDDEYCTKVDYKDVHSTPYSLYYRKTHKKSKDQGKNETIMTIPHAKTSAKGLKYMDRDKDQKLTNHHPIKGGLQQTLRNTINGSEFGWSSTGISELGVCGSGDHHSEWEEYNKLPEMDSHDFYVSPSWYFKWKKYAEKGNGINPGPIQAFDAMKSDNPMVISYARWSFLEHQYGMEKCTGESGALSTYNGVEPLQKKSRQEKEEIKLSTEKDLLKKICGNPQFEMPVVNMKWIEQWRQYVERRVKYRPGRINNLDFGCDIYLCIDEKFIPGEDFVPFYQEDFDMLIQTYGGRQRLHNCPSQNRSLLVQEKSIQGEEEIRVREKDLLSKIWGNHQFEMYAVDMKWFKQWRQYVETQKDSYHPGEINNWGIECDNCRCVKEELRPGVDFVILYQGDWNLLIRTYGVGPQVYAFHPRHSNCRRFNNDNGQASMPPVNI